MYFDVGNGHLVYYEEYGNPDGIKILFLHGGPGLGFSDADKALFDPEKFYVLFVDQRGSGKSEPRGELAYNTTQDLLSDINQILDHLKIESITVFGGSWGATLAVLYAAKNSNRVNRLILRGFFPATKECADLLLRGKIKESHPKEWKRISSLVPVSHKGKEVEFFFDEILQEGEGAYVLGKEWSRYGFSLSRKFFGEGEVDQIMDSVDVDLDRILIELNYALNGFFISEGHVYKEASKVKDTPTTIIHGRYDYLCPPKEAQRLSELISGSQLILVDAGHSITEISIKKAIQNALDKIKS